MPLSIKAIKIPTLQKQRFHLPAGSTRIMVGLSGLLWGAALFMGLNAYHVSGHTHVVNADVKREVARANQSRVHWFTVRARALSAPALSATPVAQEFPIILGGLQKAALRCGTPLSTLTTNARAGAIYAMNPEQASTPVPWAPGLRSLAIVANGQWTTLTGLACLVRYLHHRPVAVSSLTIHRQSYILVAEVLGE